MNILIVGPDSMENKLLTEAAKKRKHSVTRVSITRLVFALKDNKFVITADNKNVADHDVCLIRGVMPYFDRAKTLAKYLNRHKVPVIDKEFYNKVYAFDKMFMYAALNHHGLPCTDTYFFPNMKAFKQSKVGFDFPVIIKDLHGMHGRNIYFKRTKKEFLEFFQTKKFSKFFVQTMLDNDYYYRVLVVGNKALGAMKRYSLAYLRGKRIPLEQRSFPGELTKEMRALALKAAKATNTDVAGVDIMYDTEGHPYILEVNRSPNFKRFTQVVEVDVAAQIVGLLERCIDSRC